MDRAVLLDQDPMEEISEPVEMQQVYRDAQRAKVFQEAGNVAIYDTRSGDRSWTSRNMLPAQLKKVRADGSRVFSQRPPRDSAGNLLTPVVGKFKCLLHSDDPNRKHYDELGFLACAKSNLVSTFQVERHMQNRHRVEWATIQRERQDADRKEEKERQEKILLTLAGRANEAPAGRRRQSESE